MRKQLNLKALLILVLAVTGLGVSAYFVHGYQMKRHSRSLLDDATQLESEGRLAPAAECLSQYLLINRNDADGKARYALLLKRTADNPRKKLRAYFALSDALRADPNRSDVRRELTQMAIMFRETVEARENLAILLAEAPNDPDLRLLSARCAMLEKRDQDAIEDYRKAVKSSPTDINLALEYAMVQRRAKVNYLADQTIEQMLQATGHSPEARVAAARYYREWGNLDKAKTVIVPEKDQQAAPKADELYVLFQLARDQKKTDAMRDNLEQGRKLFPADSRFPLELARLELATGHVDKGKEHIKTLLARLPDQVDLLWTLANLVIDLGQRADAEKVIAILDQKADKMLGNVLKARLLMAQKSWSDASKLLEKARVELNPTTEPARLTNSLLAECFVRLLNPEQALEVWRRAVKLDPGWAEGQMQLAEALARSGKIEEAVATQRRSGDESPAGKAELARLITEQNMRLPSAQQHWEEVDKLIKALGDSSWDPAELAFLNAQVLATRGEMEQARLQATKSRDLDPARPGPWSFLIALAEKQNDRPAVGKLIDEAEAKLGWRIEWPMLRARQWLKADPEARKALPDPLASLDKVPDAQRNRLLAALALAYSASEERAAALRLWGELCERDPSNLNAWLQQFDINLDLKQWDAARGNLERIKQLEGPEGAFGLCDEAALVTAQAAADDTQALAAACNSAARAEAIRPGWSKPYLIEAQAYDREGRTGLALEKFKAALDRGESRVLVVRRTLELMYQQGLFGEAAELLNKLPDRAATSPELSHVAVEVTLAEPTGRQKALELARKSAQSKNYRDQVWLGQVAAQAGEPKEAEEAFRRACQLQAQAPEVWVALVGFLARADATKAEAAIEEAKKALPADKLPLTLAIFYESLGQLAQAAEQYQTALSQHASDPKVSRSAAAFLMRTGQAAKAMPILRKLLEIATAAQDNFTLRWARRNLALALAMQGGYQHFQEALALIDENLTRTVESQEDRQAKAVVLATNPAHRHEAINQFENMGGPPSQLARILLAQLYESSGDWNAAEREYRELLRVGTKNPLILGNFIRGLLRQHKPAEAKRWLNELVAIAPQSVETVELQVFVLKELGQAGEAANVVMNYRQKKDARLDLAARWYELLDRPDDSERTYRALVASSKDPVRVLQLAQLLARHKKVNEALELCDKARQTCKLDQVVASAVVIVRNGTEEQRSRVEGWISDGLKSSEQKPLGLLVYLADLKEQRGRFDEAMLVDRRILTIDPKNIVAMNNLAFLLALTRANLSEAQALIDRAIGLTGPSPGLLDTRAIIHLRRNDYDGAIKDLQQAIDVTGTGPGTAYYLAHLAQAQLAAQNPTEAADCYRKAVDAGFKTSMLHALERDDFEKIRVALQL